MFILWPDTLSFFLSFLLFFLYCSLPDLDDFWKQLRSLFARLSFTLSLLRTLWRLMKEKKVIKNISTDYIIASLTEGTTRFWRARVGRGQMNACVIAQASSLRFARVSESTLGAQMSITSKNRGSLVWSIQSLEFLYCEKL